MGIRLGMENFDELFHRSTVTPIIVNDILDTLESEKKAFDEHFITTYTDTDLMDTVPSCPCGQTRGQVFIKPDGRGVTCRECKMEVQSLLDRPLEPLLWVRAPKGVKALINPQAWRLLSDFYSLNNNSLKSFNFIKYLTNSDYRPDKDKHGRWMEEIADLGFKRSLNYFYDNFDEIIDAISQLQPFQATKDKREKLRKIRIFINTYRNEIFSQHLPVHNKLILVIENTIFGTYMDNTLKTVIDAVRNISGIDSEIKDLSVSQKENRAAKFTESIATFGRSYEKSFIAGKPGLARTKIYAKRCWFSFRAVINSLTEPCHHNELHIPWSLAMTVLRFHVMNKLYRRGFGHNDAYAFMNEYTYQYHPLLDEIFEELIDESPHELSPVVEASIMGIDFDRDNPPQGRKGIPCIFGRNPEMYRGSIQSFLITKVKKDTKQYSISYPDISTTGPNADYDGKHIAVDKSL